MSTRKSPEREEFVDEPRKKPKRGRPRASLACISCRARKVKCDVQTSPDGTCSACRSSDSRCVFNSNDDERKFGSREHIATIQGRLKAIESMMRRSFQQEQHDQQDQREELSLCSDGQTISNEVMSKSPGPAMSLVDPTQSQFLSHIPTPIIAVDNKPASISDSDILDGPRGTTFESQPSHTVFKTSTAISENPLSPRRSSPSCSRNDVGFRFDSAALTPPEDEPVHPWEADWAGGQLRFYGPTTRAHTQLPPGDPLQADTEYELEEALGTTNLDSPQLQKILFNAFWTWNDLSLTVNIVDKDLFNAHRALEEASSQYYSDFLQDSILACSSRMSTSGVIRRLGQRYADRAKGSLISHLESPTIATFQGLLLLSDFESTNGRERVGWTYAGIACRLVYDLGFHEDCSDLVKNHKITEAEAKARKVFLIAAFQNDSLWSLYFGRPGTISSAVIRETSYISNGFDHSSPSPTLDAWVQHCILVSEIASVLNSPTPFDRQSLDQLSQLFKKTQNAYQSLPSALIFRESQVPEFDSWAYALNMQYCGLQIILHRIPTLIRLRKRVLDVQNQHQNTLPGFTLEESQSIKHENAVRIAILFRSYIQIHGIERLHSVMLDNLFVAIFTLVQYMLGKQNQNPTVVRDMQWLRVLAGAMELAQKHFPVLFRMRRTMSSTVENTFLAGMFNSRLGIAPPAEYVLAAQQPPPQGPDFSTIANDTFTADFFLDAPLGYEIGQQPDFDILGWPYR